MHFFSLFTGVEGGFQTDDKKFSFVEHNSVVVLPDWKIFPLPDPELPEIVSFMAGLLSFLSILQDCLVENKCQVVLNLRKLN